MKENPVSTFKCEICYPYLPLLNLTNFSKILPTAEDLLHLQMLYCEYLWMCNRFRTHKLFECIHTLYRSFMALKSSHFWLYHTIIWALPWPFNTTHLSYVEQERCVEWLAVSFRKGSGGPNRIHQILNLRFGIIWFGSVRYF